MKYPKSSIFTKPNKKAPHQMAGAVTHLKPS